MENPTASNFGIKIFSLRTRIFHIQGIQAFVYRLLNCKAVLPVSLKLCLVLVLGAGNVWGQFSGTYTFANVTATSGTTDPTTVPTATGVTFGSFTSSIGTNPNASGRFSFTSWPLAANAPTSSNNATCVCDGSINTSSYYQVSITVASGYTVSLSSITFTLQRSGTGIRQYSVRSNADSYASNLAASISPANTDLSVVSTNIFQVTDATTSAETGNTITLSGADFTNLSAGTTRTFRFYGWNAEASGGSFSIDDVVISGTATAATPSISLADNGTQVSASSVAAGATNVVLHQSSLAVTTANATLTGVSFTTEGTYGSADISNFKVWYSADNSFATTGDNIQLGSTITTSLGAGAKSVSSLNQAINSGSTGYIFITTDIAASPTGGNAINVSALTTSDVTFSSGTKSGSTTAGGAKTLQSVSSPTITTSGTLTAVNTIYGTASASPTSFSVSGSALTNDITISPPSGYELSTTIGSGYTTSVTLAQSSGSVASTTIYVRLAATTVVGSYSGNILVASTGATTQNVATVSSAVSAKGLTITGVSVSDKVYDATTTASLTGTAAYSGLVNGESFSVTGTPSATFATKTVGSGKAVTVTGYTAPSANYTISQPIGLTATITAKALTVTSAAASNKTYDGTTAATITGTLSGVIAGDVVTLSGTGTFASANVGTGIAVTSTSTLAGVDNSNYTLSQPTGLSANITQASQNIVFGALPAKTTADVPFACGATSATSGTNALTYTSSNTAVATINASGTITIFGVGTTTITVSQSGNANYSAAADVAQTLTVMQGPCLSQIDFTVTPASWASTSITYASNEANFASNTGELTTIAISNPGSLTFDLRRTTNTSSKTLYVEVSTSTQNGTFTTISTFDHTNTTSGATTSCNVDLSTYSGFSTVYIKFRKSSSTTSPWYLRNVAVYCQSSVPQAVSTSAASSIVNTTAVLNGNLSTVGVSPNTIEKGFVYAATATNGTPLVGGTGVTKTSVAGISAGTYTLSLSDLAANTGYSYRAYAYDGTTYTYGSVLTFTTLTVASKLGFGTAPPANGSLSTNLTTFTVQTLRSDNTLDTEFGGSIIVAKATGTGNISGTLTVTASAGVATFSSVQFDALGDYTIIASSGALTTVTSSTITIVAYAVGDYRSRASGNWGVNTTWEKWSGSAWINCASGDYPNNSNASVTIRTGHVVDNDGAIGSPWSVLNLTVESGGKVWDNSFAGNNDYIKLYGDVICDGTIGAPNGDDISFEIAGGNNCTISGAGSFTATRIRKSNDLNPLLNASLLFDMDVRLTWSSGSGTVLYNASNCNSDGSMFNVTVSSGKTVRCSGPGAVTSSVSIDGLYGSNPDNTGGVYTIYGTLDLDGAFYSTTNNSNVAAPTSLIIKSGGVVKCRYLDATTSGLAGNTLRIEDGGKLNIFGSVDTISATLNDITWLNFSTTNNTWDFQSGSTIEYSGVTQQRVNGISACSNFIVSGGGLKKLGNDFTVAGNLTLTSGRVQTDAYRLIHTSTNASSLIHSTGSASFVFGTYRRYIASNTSAYELPVGLSSATSGYRRADLVNNNLSGVTYIDASVGSLSESGNNIDSRIACSQNGTALTDVLGSTIWSLVPSVQPSSGSYGVRLYVSGTGLSAADDNTFCPVKRTSGSTDFADWNTFETSTTIPSSGTSGRIYASGNGYAERNGYNSFSEHAIGKAPSNQPLPVELYSFTANCLGEDNVKLTWVTASEHNSSHFVVENSINGIDWNVSGVVNAAGTSQEILEYEFEFRTHSSLNYFRLKQVDKDGEEVIYPEISVVCSSNYNTLVTMPNPSGNEFTAVFDSEINDSSVEIQLTDIQGRDVFSKRFNVSKGLNFIVLESQTWPAGVYYLKVTAADGTVQLIRHRIL